MPRPPKVSKTDINVLPCRLAGKPEYKFVVTGPQSGRRRWRKFFESKAKAEAYAHLRRVDLTNHGVHGAALTQSQRAEYLDCLSLLDPFGVSLREAVEMVLPALAAKNKTVPVETLAREVQAAKAKDGAGKRHLEDMKSRLAVLVEAFGSRLVATITTAELDDWLRGLSVGPVGQNNFRKVVRGAFSFAVARGYCASNPAAATARAKPKDKPPGILTVEEAAALLTCADDTIRPYLAIGLFAGLRRAELERLDWSEVDLAGGHIEVAASKAKTARRRLVAIEPNLVAWLAPFAGRTGLVTPNNLRRRLATVRQAAGLGEWPENGLRHSFGSYHVAAFGSAAKTALEMGHVNAAMLFSNYRELVKPKAARLFWKIGLPNDEKGAEPTGD